MGLPTKMNSPTSFLPICSSAAFRRQKNKWEGRKNVLCVLVTKPISTGTGPDGVQMSPTFNYWIWRRNQLAIGIFISANSEFRTSEPVQLAKTTLAIAGPKRNCGLNIELECG